MRPEGAYCTYKLTELPPEVTQQILLEKDERILFAANASCEITNIASRTVNSCGVSPHRYLVMTNKRIMYVMGKGKRHDIIHSIYLEKIRTTFSASRLFGKVTELSIDWEEKNGEMKRVEYGWNHKINPLAPKSEDAKNYVDDWINWRLEEIEKQRKRERVQFVIDFSFLKAQVEKGGIVLSTIKCPNCAAAVSLPDSGNTTKCGHCGSTIHAVDVFDKLRDLIGT